MVIRVTSRAVVVVAAVVVLDGQRRVLTVRKSGTTRFMLPGGKPEAGEDLRTTAIRELAEEVGLDLAKDDLLDWGIHTDVAANEPDTTVRAGVYAWTGRVTDNLSPAAEIAELSWLELDHPTGELAPLLVTLLPRIIDFEETS
jgi:8-oxo-dGTP diphosphatase